MLEIAGREIREAAEAEARRRREVRRLPVLVSALDAVLSELEELNLRGLAAAPIACRLRAARLIAEASRLDRPLEVPETVPGLMERVYEAQDIALVRRRHAGW
jgi:hypothetical protein